MKRAQIYIDEDQDARLSQQAAALGTTKSALIRQAINTLLYGPGAHEVALGRFRAALDDLEARPLSWEAGADFAERVRARDSLRQVDLDARLTQ